MLSRDHNIKNLLFITTITFIAMIQVLYVYQDIDRSGDLNPLKGSEYIALSLNQ